MIEIREDGTPFVRNLSEEWQLLLEENLAGVNAAGIDKINGGIAKAKANPHAVDAATLANNIKSVIVQARINSHMPGETDRYKMNKLAAELYRVLCT